MKVAVDFKAIGIRVRDARLEAGLTQQQLGEAAGYSTAYITNIERGKSPTASIAVLFNIAIALEVCLDYLTGMPVKSNDAATKLQSYLTNCTPHQRKFLVDFIDDLYDNIKNNWG